MVGFLSLAFSVGFQHPMPKRHVSRAAFREASNNKRRKFSVAKTPTESHQTKKSSTSTTALNVKPIVKPVSSAAQKASTTTQLSASLTATLPSQVPSFKIFCDMDGVLVDFDAGVRKLSKGIAANELQKRRMWGLIGRAKKFYERLAWMKDGRELWDAIRHTKPDILTGVPSQKCARTQKYAWCRRELGVDVNHVDMAGSRSAHQTVRGTKKDGVTNVITCWSRNKHHESGERA